MKFVNTLLVLLGAAALGEAAGCGFAKQCQCLFNDGSHCCVYGENAQTGDTSDCTSVCAGASRLLRSGENTPAACNAGGKFSCVGIITAQGRTPCYNNNENVAFRAREKLSLLKDDVVIFGT